MTVLAPCPYVGQNFVCVVALLRIPPCRNGTQTHATQCRRGRPTIGNLERRNLGPTMPVEGALLAARTPPSLLKNADSNHVAVHGRPVPCICRRRTWSAASMHYAQSGTKHWGWGSIKLWPLPPYGPTVFTYQLVVDMVLCMTFF